MFNLIVIGALRATGDVHFTVLASAASIFFILGLGSWLMGRWWGLSGIWLAYVLDECLRGYLMWRRLQRRGWLPYARQIARGLRLKK